MAYGIATLILKGKSSFDRLTRAGAWVPSLWRLEVANSRTGQP
ncbi:MAG TPA: hypothetical protein VHY84_26850 [Bryobacteraceae bacterium]|nr:hypothetical protein [Bryobacteraceae bacterium]